MPHVQAIFDSEYWPKASCTGVSRRVAVPDATDRLIFWQFTCYVKRRTGNLPLLVKARAEVRCRDS